MFQIATHSHIPTLVLDAHLQISSYNRAAKAALPKLQKNKPVAACYPAFAWGSVERSLSQGRPASLFLEAGENGFSLSFLPLEEAEEICYYGVLHHLSPTVFDPNFFMLVHDMKTPLSIIRNTALLLGDSADQQLVDIIQRNSLRTLHLVANVGALMDGTISQSPKIVFSLSLLFLEMEAELSTLATTHGVALSFQVVPNLSSLCAPEQVERIVINLISNAIQFAMQAVSVRLYCEGDFVCFSVENDGAGIPPEEQEKIFQPWYTKSSGVRKGLGLGLVIAKEFTRENEGVLTLSSVPGQTVFTCKLPLCEALHLLYAPRGDEENRKNLLRGEFLEAFLSREKA